MVQRPVECSRSRRASRICSAAPGGVAGLYGPRDGPPRSALGLHAVLPVALGLSGDADGVQSELHLHWAAPLTKADTAFQAHPLVNRLNLALRGGPNQR